MSTTDNVNTNFKQIEICICGCGLEGSLKKAFKDGTRHVKYCKCKQCRGRNVRQSGLAAQRIAAKKLNVPKVGWGRPGNEEDYQGLLRMEVKSGAQVKPMWTAYLKGELQSEASRPHGDSRPFVFIARVLPTGGEGLYVIKESRLEETVYALAVQIGLIDP